jgi:Co/Zn/Cd efflux system component
MSAHVEVEAGTPADRILDELHVVLHARFGIDHTTIQIETEAPSLLQITPRS